ncbi:hypothetical protein BH09MYX1_BH09MYX1_36830 [soil metagenome]
MAQLCARCGAPRTRAAAACEYCKTLFDPGTALALPRELPVEFHDAMKDDNLIAAIKIFRDTRGVGLKEARDAVLALKKT